MNPSDQVDPLDQLERLLNQVEREQLVDLVKRILVHISQGDMDAALDHELEGVGLQVSKRPIRQEPVRRLRLAPGGGG